MLNIRKITVVILLRYTAKPTTKPLPVLIIIIPYHQAYLRQVVVLACICILVQRSQRDRWRQTGARDVTALAAGDWRESQSSVTARQRLVPVHHTATSLV